MWQVLIDNHELQNKVMSITAAENLGSQNNSYSIKGKGIDSLFHFREMSILKNNNKRFGGIVLDQSFQDRGIKFCNISSIDYNYILQNRVVAESLGELTVSQALIFLLTKYAPEITLNSLRPCNISIERLVFDYVPLSEAIKNIMEYVPAWHHYIDQNMDFHLFADFEKNGISFLKTNGKYNFMYNTLSVKYNAKSVINRVWIVGSKQASPKDITQYFTGDAQQRYFTLAYEPNYTKVYVNGILMKSKLDSNDDLGQDFLINKKNKVLFIPENIIDPFVGEVKVVYQPTIQVIDYFENTRSENPFLIEKVIKNKSITDKMSARQYGKAEIRRSSRVKAQVIFTTREEVKIGERCYLNIEEYNVNGYFLVVQVNTEITPSDEKRGITLEEI